MPATSVTPANPQPATEQAAPQLVRWSPAVAIFGTLGLFFGGMLLTGMVMVLVLMVLGWSQTQVQQWMEENTWGQFITLAISQAAVLGGLLLVLRRYKSSFKTLGLVWPRWRDVGWAFTGLAMYVPLMIATTMVTKALVPSLDLDQEQQIGFSGAHGSQLVLVFIALCILPPLAEELLVRGFLYLGLRTRLRQRWAVLFTSALFAAAHLQFGSGAPLLWTAAIDTFVLSLVLIYLRNKTGNLCASIGLHMLKNSIAFTALFLVKLY